MEIKMKGRAAVVMLGDIGRSPWMQYHALSLANQAGMEVDIVADGGTMSLQSNLLLLFCTPFASRSAGLFNQQSLHYIFLFMSKFVKTYPHMAVIENLSIHLHKMRPIHLRRLSNISRPLVLVLKTFIQFVQLIWFLCVKIPRPDVFIVQNPPSVPTLAAVKLASWLRRSKFVIDWHNFGYTLHGLSHGRSHPFVKIYHRCELFFGRMAHGTLCVMRAMKHELDQNWGIKVCPFIRYSYVLALDTIATVLYDQPPEFFNPTSLEEKHELFYRLQKELCHSHGILDCVRFEMRGQNDSSSREGNESDSKATLFSTKVGHDIFLKPNRPALVVSSTSWTSDEDFGLLLEAAVLYDRRAAAALKEDDMAEVEMLWSDISNGKQCLYPRLLFIITCKGPDREKYENQIKKLQLKCVAFRTMWLSAEDYPLLLGSADLGVCLHTSSSGLDLPMKVVDMFGCGLPVCAVSYSCIEELVQVGTNGFLFSKSSELADELLLLFKGFPEKNSDLKLLRDGTLASWSSAKWANKWEEHALPLIDKVVLRTRDTES